MPVQAAMPRSVSTMRAADRKAPERAERDPLPRMPPSPASTRWLVRLLTLESRQLLAIIRDRRPPSVTALAEMTGRAQPNLTRTLAKLAAAGFITTRARGRRKGGAAPRSGRSQSRSTPSRTTTDFGRLLRL